VVLRADFRRAHDKVAVFVILVKWAKASHVNTSLAQRYELANNLLDLGSVEHLVNDPFFNFRHKNLIINKGVGFIINEGTSFDTNEGSGFDIM
jgi:hypothetical protein